ncbi:hypothetical protein PMIN01_05946 [Paraphaeosphaeria minitans]|uniref:Uncharacterized protein n=1 Tax=Paraphaeosphaeria minitans TaxID=565426 RepID=A0A9P6KRN8_9PLEO|nr:hypothetical protein PMIN01_05946 [Paraphaeosphaeria minitans]
MRDSPGMMRGCVGAEACDVWPVVAGWQQKIQAKSKSTEEEPSTKQRQRPTHNAPSDALPTLLSAWCLAVPCPVNSLPACPPVRPPARPPCPPACCSPRLPAPSAPPASLRPAGFPQTASPTRPSSVSITQHVLAPFITQPIPTRLCTLHHPTHPSYICFAPFITQPTTPPSPGTQAPTSQPASQPDYAYARHRVVTAPIRLPCELCQRACFFLLLGRLPPSRNLHGLQCASRHRDIATSRHRARQDCFPRAPTSLSPSSAHSPPREGDVGAFHLVNSPPREGDVGASHLVNSPPREGDVGAFHLVNSPPREGDVGASHLVNSPPREGDVRASHLVNSTPRLPPAHDRGSLSLQLGRERCVGRHGRRPTWSYPKKAVCRHVSHPFYHHQLA